MSKDTVISMPMRELTAEECLQAGGGVSGDALSMQLSDFNPVSWSRINIPKVAKSLTEKVILQ